MQKLLSLTGKRARLSPVVTLMDKSYMSSHLHVFWSMFWTIAFAEWSRNCCRMVMVLVPPLNIYYISPCLYGLAVPVHSIPCVLRYGPMSCQSHMLLLYRISRLSLIRCQVIYIFIIRFRIGPHDTCTWLHATLYRISIFMHIFLYPNYQPMQS